MTAEPGSVLIILIRDITGATGNGTYLSQEWLPADLASFYYGQKLHSSSPHLEGGASTWARGMSPGGIRIPIEKLAIPDGSLLPHKLLSHIQLVNDYLLAQGT